MGLTDTVRKLARDLQPGDHIECADHERVTVELVHATKRNVLIIHQDNTVRHVSLDARIIIHPTSEDTTR